MVSTVIWGFTRGIGHWSSPLNFTLEKYGKHEDADHSCWLKLKSRSNFSSWISSGKPKMNKSEGVVLFCDKTKLSIIHEARANSFPANQRCLRGIVFCLVESEWITVEDNVVGSLPATCCSNFDTKSGTWKLNPWHKRLLQPPWRAYIKSFHVSGFYSRLRRIKLWNQREMVSLFMLSKRSMPSLKILTSDICVTSDHTTERPVENTTTPHWRFLCRVNWGYIFRKFSQLAAFQKTLVSLAAALALYVMIVEKVESRYVLHPSQRLIVQLKQLYLDDKAGTLCEDNPVMSVECDACDELGLSSKETCCGDLLQFSECHHSLEPLLREMKAFNGKMPDIVEAAEPAKRYASTFARWGYSRGSTPVQWGRRIRARKRFGAISGSRFNFDKFRQGDYMNYRPEEIVR